MNGELDAAMLEGMREASGEKYPCSFDCRLVQHSKNLPEAIDHFIRENQINVLALTTHRRNLLTRFFNPHCPQTDACIHKPRFWFFTSETGRRRNCECGWCSAPRIPSFLGCKSFFV